MHEDSNLVNIKYTIFLMREFIFLLDSVCEFILKFDEIIQTLLIRYLGSLFLSQLDRFRAQYVWYLILRVLHTLRAKN